MSDALRCRRRSFRLQSEHQQPGFTREEREDNDVEAGFDAPLELGLFGRVRRSREAARAQEQIASRVGISESDVTTRDAE